MGSKYSQKRIMIINYVRRRLQKAIDEKTTIKYGGKDYVKIIAEEWEAFLGGKFKDIWHTLNRMIKDGLIRKYRANRAPKTPTFYAVDLLNRGEDYTKRELYPNRKSKAIEILNCYAEVVGQKLEVWSPRVFVGACVVVKRFFGGSIEKFREYLVYLKTHCSKITKGIFNDKRGVLKIFFVKIFTRIFGRVKMWRSDCEKNKMAVKKKWSSEPLNVKDGDTLVINNVDWTSFYGFLALNYKRNHTVGEFIIDKGGIIQTKSSELYRVNIAKVKELYGILRKRFHGAGLWGV